MINCENDIALDFNSNAQNRSYFLRNENLPSILEPDLHLSLVQSEIGGDFHSSSSRQVFVVMELFF